MPHALVIGGSVGGLFAAHLLRRAGWSVAVYERVADDLATRGAGIAITQDLLDVMTRIGIPFDPTIGAPIPTYGHVARDGTVATTAPRRTLASAWARVYRPLRAAFPDDFYHAGTSLARVEQTDTEVTAYFEDGGSAVGDLLIAADGTLSTARAQFLPDVAPQYAGYIAWRGIVPGPELPAATMEFLSERIAFSFAERELMLAMKVSSADGDPDPSAGRTYFIWYRPVDGDAAMRDLFTDASGRDHGRSIPPPLIRPDLIAAMKAKARELFAPTVAEAVTATKLPLLQAIADVESPSLVFGRVALLGDAAFVARPHVTGGISKAALDAEVLARLAGGVADGGDLAPALARYDRERRAFGQKLVDHARLLGRYIERPDTPRPEIPWILDSYGAPHLLKDPDLAAFGVAAA